MIDPIQYTSPNGYTGILSGKSSLLIFDKDGVEIMHTAKRAINNLFELREQVDNFPQLWDEITAQLEIEREDIRT